MCEKNQTQIIPGGRHDLRYINYFMIAHQSLVEYEALLNQENTQQERDGLDELALKRRNCGFVVTVFSAMCLEALMYDYGARHFTDSFVDKYLDKLTLLQKVVLYPKLSTSREFPVGHQSFQLLKNLVKQRNGMVHHKTSPLPTTPDGHAAMQVRAKNEFENDPEQVRDAFRALPAVVDDLLELHGGDEPFLTDFRGHITNVWRTLRP